MSIEVIYNLQRALASLLNSKKTSLLKGVYFSPQQDPKFPYLLFNRFKSLHQVMHNADRYELYFEAMLFTRNMSAKDILPIIEIVIEITKDNFKIEECQIINFKHISTEISHGHDLITTKTSLEFKILIELSEGG
jgi:hypothetical protein